MSASDARLIVPPLDAEPYPTLGWGVVDFIEANLVHGPGDILGEPAHVHDEFLFFILRAYEVFPRGHERAGRRRFKRVVLSRRKGFAKTELAAWLAIAEHSPDAPVRCDGWRVERGEYVPVGVPVTDPYVPMVATTEEQVEDLAYGAVYAILERAPIADDYDIGLERILHTRAPGKIQALAAAPSARDGARTTFFHEDETHLFVPARLREADATMKRNLAKRFAADPWGLATTTMYGPGEGSIAEDDHAYALAVQTGEIEDSSLYFDHRQASESHKLTTKAGLRAAVTEASGAAIEFADVHAIEAQYHDDKRRDRENDFRRYWLNQRRKLSTRWINVDVWNALADVKRGKIADGTRIVLGFDGSYRNDSTALVAATVEARPHLFPLRVWERPPKAPANWRVSRIEVDEAVDDAMERYDVAELAGDPHKWHRAFEDWAVTYGEVVAEFDTTKPTLMGPACEAFEQATRPYDDTGETGLSHDGSRILARHVGNAVTVRRGRFTVIEKSEQDSPDKIDAAVAGVIAYARARWHFLNSDDGGKEILVAWV